MFFELGPVAPENMPFRDISYLQLWQPACLAEQSYNLKAILLESIMRNISAKLFCICTSAEFRLSFQLLEILTLQVFDHEMISTVILLPSANSFKKGCCQLQAKVCARITG